MLPILQIISSSKRMSIHEAPIKPRRKKIEVPVHSFPETESIRKSYGANFNSKKCKHKNIDQSNDAKDTRFTEVILEIPETDSNPRINRKQLNKEIHRLAKENEEIVSKFNELEQLSVKKITKLKEKIVSLQNINTEVARENEYIKSQYQELLTNFDNVRTQLELSKHCQSCYDLRSSLDKANSDNLELQKRNKELNEDLNMLKTVVYRLNLQMERYQEKLRKLNIKVTQPAFPTPNSQITENNHVITGNLSESHQSHHHSPIAWGNVNIHTLSPLLDAYQDNLNEKEEIILGYETEISNFTGKLKQIISENETLHKRLTEDDDCSTKLRNELANIKLELKSTKEQNDVLIKKCALKQDKVEEILKCYEHKVEQLKRDYSVAQEQYFKCRNEVTALKEKNKSLIDAHDDFKNERQNYIPISVHTASVNECKRWYEELKVQYENEKTKLKESLDAKTALISDIETKLSTMLKTKEELQLKLINLEKHIKKSEAKYLELEHTLNEVQLSRSACRKQLHKVMSFAKDMVAEQETLLKALNQRQIENKVVKKIGSDMASRMDLLKTQLKDVQKNAWQEFSTVEQKIQDQENIIETMKSEHEQEIEKLQQIIKEQEETNTLLKHDNSIPLPHYLLFRDKHK